MQNYTTTCTTLGNDLVILLRSPSTELLKKNRTEFALVILSSLIFYRLYRWKKSYIHLPYVGIPSGLFGSWRAGWNFMNHSVELIQEGYSKHASSGQAFVLAGIPRYMVFITDQEHIEEMRRAKDTDMSFSQAIAEEKRQKIPLLTDPSLNDGVNDYHIDLVRQNLTQRLANMLPEVYGEADLAWRETAVIGKDWTRVKIWDVMLEVIVRTSNRLFVGVPLCRNKEYLDIVLSFAVRMGKTGPIIDHVPPPIRSAVLWYMLKRFRLPQRAEKILGPIFDERRRRQRELGEEKWNAQKPNDMIQWILDAAATKSKKMQSHYQLTMRVMLINFAAIHTTSLTILHAIYDLVAHPEYLEPLREEIVSVLEANGGYTKQSLTAMKKLDSVLKESQRCNGMASLLMSRVTMKDYTFKSGRPLTIPKGTFVTVPVSAIHRSDTFYGPDAGKWKGFRFSDIREDKESSAKHQMVSLNSTYLAFGLGKHACPGRFFAANELKILLSYLLLRYDIRLPVERGGKRPSNVYVLGTIRVDTTVELEFKPRKQWKDLENRWGMPGASQ